MTRTWVSAAVFGAFDGVTSSLGVLLGLASHPSIVLPAAVGVGAAETVGMAAGQWLSDSDDGLGAATGAGCVTPALPYALAHGTVAAAAACVLVLALTAGIALLRSAPGARVRPFAQSYAILAAVAAVVLAVHQLTPAGA